MPAATKAPRFYFRLETADLQALIDALQARNYTVIGPVRRDGALMYDELDEIAALPAGWGDEQKAGSYRLQARQDQALFGYAVGPSSLKQFLHPARVRLFRAIREDGGFRVEPDVPEKAKFAFIGVRACDLAAIDILDRVLANGTYQDPTYAARRDDIFVCAVHCTRPGGTCFCASMGTGPEATDGFDLALTEILDGEAHYFIGEVGSELGEAVLREVPHSGADTADVALSEQMIARAGEQMGRSLQTSGLRETLLRNLEHPRWDDAANRCLSCANCTMVCPTCFCTNVEDVTDLSGETAERWRQWDSCFTVAFSYIHGGSIRPSAKSRYRQWLMHKLASWYEQFGTAGCVGCGRCITWCPAAIDITEEARAIQETDSRKPRKEPIS